MQKGIRLNDGHVTYLGLLAKKDGTRRGYLSKKSSDNTKWHTKWFALLQNMLFYFENDSSSRPAGLYLLEGCACDRAPSPKPSLSAKECLEKQIGGLLKDNERIQSDPTTAPSDDDSDIKKIKKVQSFLRGWMCRRKWKTIIQDYIRSPHAESMRKRNQVVFSMLEAEAEYVQQLHILVNNFLRPLRMAASSKKPSITHDDIPRYILTLHELLAHTPHEHVERNSLEYAKSKLEELSRIMHDEVSETENIRKNLAIERMIVEGCEILLDTSQTFVRQAKPDKSGQDMEHLDFKIVVEPKDTQSFTVILCIDNIRCNGLMMNAFEENSKVTVPQMIKSDTSLYCDDVDIRFSKMMNSCKVLQIRYASVERLLERLTDLRFLSIDFLNTFLHSYRVFTTAEVVLDKLITIYKKPISAIPARSLELFFASSQNNKLLYGEPPKSPRASRKFSSPPPLSITKTSSPNRRRKLSLNIPIITGGKALDLAALSCSSNGYASMYSSMSPFSKTSLDINKLYVSTSVPNKIPDEAETKTDKPDEPSCNKQDFSLFSYNNGVVVTSCRELDNNRSALSAASAFAIATAGANEGTPTKEKYRRMSLASTGYPTDQRNGDKEFVIRRAATNRVLNVLRHWVSKHAQDFESNSELKFKVISFLEEVIHDPELLTQERKAAANIIRTLTQEDPGDNQITLEEIVQMAEGVQSEPFDNHSALEIAEQLTLLDHLVFKGIPYECFTFKKKTPSCSTAVSVSSKVTPSVLVDKDVNVYHDCTVTEPLTSLNKPKEQQVKISSFFESSSKLHKLKFTPVVTKPIVNSTKPEWQAAKIVPETTKPDEGSKTLETAKEPDFDQSFGIDINEWDDLEDFDTSFKDKSITAGSRNHSGKNSKTQNGSSTKNPSLKKKAFKDSSSKNLDSKGSDETHEEGQLGKSRFVSSLEDSDRSLTCLSDCAPQKDTHEGSGDEEEDSPVKGTRKRHFAQPIDILSDSEEEHTEKDIPVNGKWKGALSKQSDTDIIDIDEPEEKQSDKPDFEEEDIDFIPPSPESETFPSPPFLKPCRKKLVSQTADAQLRCTDTSFGSVTQPFSCHSTQISTAAKNDQPSTKTFQFRKSSSVPCEDSFFNDLELSAINGIQTPDQTPNISSRPSASSYTSLGGQQKGRLSTNSDYKESPSAVCYTKSPSPEAEEEQDCWYSPKPQSSSNRTLDQTNGNITEPGDMGTFIDDDDFFFDIDDFDEGDMGDYHDSVSNTSTAAKKLSDSVFQPVKEGGPSKSPWEKKAPMVNGTNLVLNLSSMSKPTPAQSSKSSSGKLVQTCPSC
ncbi:UNVERIFIED_CONTAM: hypothetical protein FKN15_017813 [Acipenser sinensis]